MQAGVMAGFPLVDVKVTLFDGSFHEVDSSEMAFKIAGSMAFKEACGRQVLPFGAHYEGRRGGSRRLHGRRHRRHFRRRGNILGMIPRNGATQIDANVPLAEMFGYATDLRVRPRAVASTPWSPATMRSCPSLRARRLWRNSSAHADKFFLPFCRICIQ